jgi:fumarylacetoacetase
MIDPTHDPSRSSWVETASGHPDFPIQNLPFGVFAPGVSEAPRGGVAIGDFILDLGAALDQGLFSGPLEAAAEAASGGELNPFMALPAEARAGLRARLSELLDADGPERSRVEPLARKLLHRARNCTMRLPAAIGDYTDFYAGIHHAENVGRLMRPDNPLLPNYKHVPIGYHGRASSVRVSGAEVRRPSGQRKPASADEPVFGPTQRLDYELELGAWIGPGNVLGRPIPITEASQHIVGLCLLNDWSAREIQAWEYQPLGPFLAKSFLTTISPWVVTAEALEPFRVTSHSRPAGDPEPLPYLSDPYDQACGGFDIDLEVLISSEAMRNAGMAPHLVSRCNARDLYWTVAQMIAHHASGGCNLRPGDLFGTGTISSDDPANVGSLLELSRGGQSPIELSSGEERAFLEDGDEVVLRASCRRDGAARIGFGEARGKVVAAA